MVAACVALGCGYRKGPERRNDDITLHKFPFSRTDMLTEWVKALKREDFKPSRNSRICSQHFLNSDFVPGKKIRMLKQSAVPSVFDFVKHLSKDPNLGCKTAHTTRKKKMDRLALSRMLAEDANTQGAYTVATQTDPVFVLSEEDIGLLSLGLEEDKHIALTLNQLFMRDDWVRSILGRHRCEMCGAAFVDPVQLELHRWVHQMATPRSPRRKQLEQLLVRKESLEQDKENICEETTTEMDWSEDTCKSEMSGSELMQLETNDQREDQRKALTSLTQLETDRHREVLASLKQQVQERAQSLLKTWTVDRSTQCFPPPETGGTWTESLAMAMAMDRPEQLAVVTRSLLEKEEVEESTSSLLDSCSAVRSAQNVLKNRTSERCTQSFSKASKESTQNLLMSPPAKGSKQSLFKWKPSKESSQNPSKSKVSKESTQNPSKLKASKESTQNPSKLKASKESTQNQSKLKASKESTQNQSKSKVSKESTQIQAKLKASKESTQNPSKLKASKESTQNPSKLKASKESTKNLSQSKSSKELTQNRSKSKASRKSIQNLSKFKASKGPALLEIIRKSKSLPVKKAGDSSTQKFPASSLEEEATKSKEKEIAGDSSSSRLCPICGEDVDSRFSMKFHLSSHLYYDIVRGEILMAGNRNGAGLGLMENRSSSELAIDHSLADSDRSLAESGQNGAHNGRNNDQIKIEVDQSETDGDQNRTGGDQNRTDSDQNRTGGDQNRTDSDQNKTDSDQNKTDCDQTRTDNDQNRTDNDQNRTGGDRNRTDSDHNKTDSDQNKTDCDQNKTDSDHNKTDSDQNKTDSDQNRTDSDHNKTDSDQNKTDSDQNITDNDHNRTDGDQNKTDSDQNRTDSDENRTDSDQNRTDSDQNRTDNDQNRTDGEQNTETVKSVTFGQISVTASEFMFTCTSCNVGFRHKKYLFDHRQAKHSTVKMIYKGKNLVERRPKEMSSYICEICGAVYPSAARLEVHVHSHSENMSECEICHMKFTSPMALTKHIRYHVKDENGVDKFCPPPSLSSFICEVCGKVIKGARYMRYHMARHRGEARVNCAHCDQTFPSKYHLDRHKRKQHEIKKPYACKLCPASYTLPFFLKRHHYTVHVQGCEVWKPNSSGSKPKMYPCDRCGKLYQSKRKLSYHMNVHTGEKPFGCEDCSRRFTNPLLLKNHRRVHVLDKIQSGSTDINESDTRYNCPYCGKFFYNEFNQVRHIRQHTGQDLFTCDICGKNFAYKITFNRHMQGHRGEKPHECDICHKRFLNPSNMQRHRVIHSGEKPFKCPVCGRGFSQKGAMKAHHKLHDRDHTSQAT